MRVFFTELKLFLISAIMCCCAFSSDDHCSEIPYSLPLRRTFLSFLDTPFDNIQTNMQASKQLISYKDMVISLYQKGGLYSFWRGIIPRLGITYIRSFYQLLFFEYIPKGNFFSSCQYSGINNGSIAFAIGITDSLLTNILEIQKVRQMTKHSCHLGTILKPGEYITRGNFAMFQISFWSWFIFLESEEYLRNNLKSHKTDTHLCIKDFLYIGLLTGFIDSFWTTPFYNIKNQQQSFYSIGKDFKETFFSIYKQKGIRGFYAGFLLDFLRASLFCTFDTWSRELIEKAKWRHLTKGCNMLEFRD